MHPYVHTTVCGNQIDSSPHNLITGAPARPPPCCIWTDDTPHHRLPFGLQLASPEARRWNALSGTNFAPTSTNSLWQSETTRQFCSKSPTWARPGETSGGMRTEQLIFDAKYVN